MATKQAVLDYLKHNRTLMVARNLYNKLPGKSLATQTYISRLPDTARSIRLVSYELCKLVGISERQMNALLNQPVSLKKVTSESKDSKVPTTEQMQEKLLAFNPDEIDKIRIDELANFLSIKVEVPSFSKGHAGTKERKEFADNLNIKVEGRKHEDYDKAFMFHAEKVVIEKIIAAKELMIKSDLEALDDTTKESIKLRDQFPFLRDPDCPRELHLLVADLITAYETFVEKQPLLHNQATQEQLKDLVQDVKASYIEKKEIFTELEHYKEHKTLLGKHPLFIRLKNEEELKSLNSVDLAKKISNLENNINRNKGKLENSETEEEMAKYAVLVEDQESLKEFAQKELSNRK